jgi:hypothetical protein
MTASFLHEGDNHAQQRTDPRIPSADTPRGPTPTPGIPDRVQEKPPLTPVQDPGDSKNPQDPTLDPALAADRRSGRCGVTRYFRLTFPFS